MHNSRARPSRAALAAGGSEAQPACPSLQPTCQHVHAPPPGGAVLIHLVDTVSRPDRKPHTRHVVNAQWSAVLADASSLEIVSRLELGHQASAFCGDGRGYSEQAAHRGTMST